jgi:hypothetical protein
MPKFRINETAEHCSVYEVEAETKEEAVRLLQEDYTKHELVEEFWGQTHQDVEEVT